MTNIPDTFRDISLNILDMTANKCYRDISVKTHELKRQTGHEEPQILLLESENMRGLADFKYILQSSETFFCTIILKVFSSDKAATLLRNRTL